MRIKTIRTKLMALIMSICFLALITAGIILLLFIRSSTYETLVREIQTDALLTAENCNVALAFQNQEDVQKVLSALKSQPFVVYGTVQTPEGEPFATYRRSDQADHLDENHYPESHFIKVDQAIIFDQETLGTLTLVADLVPLTQASQRALWTVSGVIALTLLFSGLLAAKLQGLISKPVLELAGVADRVSATQDYSHRADIASLDEIGHLARMFNKMLDQIDQRDQKLVHTNQQLQLEVTVRQRAESRLEAINQELQGFAYIVSHDLKAPLRGIKSLATWLLDDYEDQLDQEGCENLRLLNQRVDRMRNLIDGILQYSRAGREQNPAEPVNLETLVTEIIETLEVPNHITIERPRPLPEVLYDPVRMLQVMQNLLSNAIKYMDKDQGHISVEWDEDPQAWTLRIVDNGPGIPEEYHEKIFAVFQTLQSRDSYESTGVGLAVVKKIVENAGGRIWVVSQEGQGSTFCFTVLREPAGSTKVESQPATTEASASR